MLLDVVCGDGRRHFRADVSHMNLFLVPVNFSDDIFHLPCHSLARMFFSVEKIIIKKTDP